MHHRPKCDTVQYGVRKGHGQSLSRIVRSIPAGSAQEATTLAIAKRGDRLRSLPDGETGERRNWIIHIIEALRTHPDFELAREGPWSDYDKTPLFKLAAGKRLSAAALNLGYTAALNASYETFKALRAEHGLEGLAYQVGIPGGKNEVLESDLAPGSTAGENAADEQGQKVKRPSGYPASQSALFGTPELDTL